MKDPKTPRTARRLPLLSAALAVAALALGGCEPGEEQPVPPLPPEGAADVPEEFASRSELARAVRNDTYAERVELPEIELATPPAPERVTVRLPGGTEVPEDQLPPLRALAEAVLGDDALRLSLIGCSDTSGPAGLNQRISRQRAESVAAALQRLGVPEARIDEIEGRGEDCEEPERAVHVTVRRAESGSS